MDKYVSACKCVLSYTVQIVRVDCWYCAHRLPGISVTFFGIFRVLGGFETGGGLNDVTVRTELIGPTQLDYKQFGKFCCHGCPLGSFSL